MAASPLRQSPASGRPLRYKVQYRQGYAKAARRTLVGCRCWGETCRPRFGPCNWSEGSHRPFSFLVFEQSCTHLFESSRLAWKILKVIAPTEASLHVVIGAQSATVVIPMICTTWSDKHSHYSANTNGMRDSWAFLHLLWQVNHCLPEDLSHKAPKNFKWMAAKGTCKHPFCVPAKKALLPGKWLRVVTCGQCSSVSNLSWSQGDAGHPTQAKVWFTYSTHFVRCCVIFHCNALMLLFSSIIFHDHKHIKFTKIQLTLQIICQASQSHFANNAAIAAFHFFARYKWLGPALDQWLLVAASKHLRFIIKAMFFFKPSTI